MVQLVKNLPAMWETWVPSLGWVDALENGKANSKDYIAHGVPKSQTQLSNFHFQGCILSPCLFNLYAEDIM